MACPLCGHLLRGSTPMALALDTQFHGIVSHSGKTPIEGTPE